MSRPRLSWWKPALVFSIILGAIWSSLLAAPAPAARAFQALETATPTPTATPTATPTVTATPRPTATVPPTPTATPVLSATQPVATVSPTTINFGSVPQETNSANQTVTLTNTGGANLTFLTAPELKGGDSLDFTIGPNSCGTAAPLAPATSCTVVVRFTPVRNALGNRSTTLLFRDNSVTGSPQFVLLNGVATVATAPTPTTLDLTFAPTTVTFGAQPLGTTSGSQFVVVTNTGTGNVTITAIEKSGGDAADFSEPSTNCLITLAPGAQCQLSLTFTPRVAGNRATTIIVTDNVPRSGSTQVIVVSGTGSGAALAPTVALPPAPTTGPVPPPTPTRPPAPTAPPATAPPTTAPPSPTPNAAATAPIGTPTATAPVEPLPGLPNTGSGAVQPVGWSPSDQLTLLALSLLALVAFPVYRRWLRKG